MSGGGNVYSSVEPQCVAKKGDGERCANGTTYSPILCGTHKRVDDVTLVPDEDDREWCKCPHCGWQPVTWGASGDPPYCGACGVEIPYEAPRWSEKDEQ